MQDKASKRSICTSNIVNCIQEVKVNNSGQIIGNIKVDQSVSSCKQLINSSTTPTTPATPGTPAKPATPGTPATPATPGTPTTPGTPATPATPGTPGTPIKPPVLNPPPPAPPSDKILGLEKNVFYGVTGGVVLLILIVIGVMVMKNKSEN